MYVMRKLKLTEIEELRIKYGFTGGKVWFFSSLSPSITSVMDGCRTSGNHLRVTRKKICQSESD